MRTIAIVALLALGLAAPRAEGAPAVAVFAIDDTREKGRLSQKQRDNLTDYLSSQLGAGGVFKIIPKAELQAALRSAKAETYRQCYDESCQIEIGKEVAAEKSVATKIVRFGTTCIITSVLYDLRRGSSDTSGHFKGKCDSDTLLSGLEAVASQLRSGTQTPATDLVEDRQPAVVRSDLLVVDRQAYLVASPEGQAAKARLKEVFDTKQADLNRRQQELRVLRERVLAASDAERSQLRREYENGVRELQARFASSQKGLKTSEAAMTAEIMPRVDAAIAKLASAKSARLILDGGHIAYLDPCLDDTHELLPSRAKQDCEPVRPPLLAFVDIQRVLKDSDAGRRELAALQRDHKAKQADLDRQTSALRAKKKRGEATAAEYSALQKKYAEFGSQLKAAQAAAKARLMASTVDPALARVAKAHSVSVIFDSQKILHGVQAADCTDAVLGAKNAQCEGITTSRLRVANVELVLKSSATGKRAMRKLTKKKAQLQHQIDRRHESLKQRKGRIPEAQYNKELQRLQQDFENKQSKLAEQEAKFTQKVLAKITRAAKPLAALKGADIVLYQDVVAYAAQDLSMTTELIQAVDKGAR